jgi:TonB family protein
MTGARGEPGDETESPVAARPDPAAAVAPYPVWIAPLAWALAVLLVVALSGLAAMVFHASGAAVQKVADRIETAADDLRPEPDVAPLPGLPPARPETDKVSADEGASGPVEISEPSWRVRPGVSFPDKALRLGVEVGEVVLDCPVDIEGRIASCWIVSETPADVGFGQAALEGAIQARLTPRTVNGVAKGGRVRFTTRFALK